MASALCRRPQRRGLDICVCSKYCDRSPRGMRAITAAARLYARTCDSVRETGAEGTVLHPCAFMLRLCCHGDIVILPASSTPCQYVWLPATNGRQWSQRDERHLSLFRHVRAFRVDWAAICKFDMLCVPTKLSFPAFARQSGPHRGWACLCMSCSAWLDPT